MSGQVNEPNGSVNTAQNESYRAPDTARRDSVRPSSGPKTMSVLSHAPPPPPAFFDKPAGGRFELPPLKQSFSFHGPTSPFHSLHLPAYHESDGQKKRKIHHMDSNYSAPPALESAMSSNERVQPSPRLSHSNESSFVRTDQERRRSLFISPSPTTTINSPLAQPHVQPQRAAPQPSIYEQSVAKSSPKSTTRPEIFNLPEHSHQSSPRPDGSNRMMSHIPLVTSASPSLSLRAREQSGVPSPTSYGHSHEMRMRSTDGHRLSPGRDGSSNASASPHTTRSGPAMPMTTTGPTNSYQMMTLQTSSGTMQVPVDIQAASKLADEKRRRNAGASARFRERRKRKEVEASATISRLERQVKELSEDSDYYRRERDYFVNAVLQMPGGERHFPRPTGSPRLHRRPHVPSNAGSTSDDSNNYDSIHERHDGGHDNYDMQGRRGASFSNTPEPHTGARAFPFSNPAVARSPQPLNLPPRFSESRVQDDPDGVSAVPAASSGSRDAMPPRGMGYLTHTASEPLPRIQDLQPRPWMPSLPMSGPREALAGHNTRRHWPNPHSPHEHRPC